MSTILMKLAVGSRQWAVGRRSICLAFAAYSLLPTAYSQPGGYSTTDKGAIKRYESGAECMRLQKWECAENEFTKAAAADERFVEPRIMLAEIAEQQGKDDVAMARYREVLASRRASFP